MINKNNFTLVATFLFWLLACPSSALQLFDGQNFVYDVGKDGALMQGTRDAYAGLYFLRINEAAYQGKVTGMSTDGREIFFSTFSDPTSHLDIERRIYVPKRLNFARYMEILRNPTDVDVTVDVALFGNLGSGDKTVKLADQGHFLITSASNPTTYYRQPVLLHYHSQVGSAISATHQLSGSGLSWRWSQLKVPAKKQIRLLSFIAQTENEEQAKQVANLIFNNPILLYENLNAGARAEILNFTAPLPSPTQDFSDGIPLSSQVVQYGTLSETDTWSHRRAATPADRYVLNLSDKQTVTIRLSAAFNTYLYLYGDVAGTTVLAANDDADSRTTNAQIVFTAPKAGTYCIEATAYQRSDRGEYSLEVIEGAVNQLPQVYPFMTEADQWTAPSVVTFTELSPAGDGHSVERCWLFGDGSAIECRENTNTITHTFEKGGYYTVGVTVRDNQGAYGQYSEPLSIRMAGTEVVLPLSNTVNDRLTATDGYSLTRTQALADRYLLKSVVAGQALLIEMTATEFPSAIYVYDTSGRRLAQTHSQGNTVQLRYIPLKNGDLIVEATSLNDNGLGNYRLSVNPVSHHSGSIPIESVVNASNPLRYLFMARLPATFRAQFLWWNFGDGSQPVSTNEAVVSHTFSRSGNFTVTVSATSDSNEQANGSQKIPVGTTVGLPKTQFSAAPLFGESPLQVFFTEESRSTLQGDTLDYLWQFGDGTVATGKAPTHTFHQEGGYMVVLQTTSAITQQATSFSLPIAVIDRNHQEIPVTGVARQRPQVLLAGFDPILVDLQETDTKLFALVRPGTAPLKTVRVVQNQGDLTVVMQQVATYANGDQRFEAIYPFPRGVLPVSQFPNLFGDQAGQLYIQAIDQSGQMHAFPNLEVGKHAVSNRLPTSLHIEPLRHAGIRRNLPQVLGAGFDPPLVDERDTGFTVLALVREGMFPLQNVSLLQNGTAFNMPMQCVQVFPNGDKLFATTYTYPYSRLSQGTFSTVFGDQPLQFMVVALDQAGQTHRFPEYRIGNFAPH